MSPEDQVPAEQAEAADEFVEAVLAERKADVPRELKGEEAEALRMAALLASVTARGVVPSHEFMTSLHERITGQQRPTWLNWRLSRRTLARGLAGAAGAVVVCLFGEQALQRVAGQQIPAGWVPVARAAELPPGACKRFIAHDVEGHIMNINGTIWALSAICTHQACVLQWQTRSQTFLCPCHGAQFGANGRQVNEAGYGYSLPPLSRIPVQQRDGRIYVVLAS